MIKIFYCKPGLPTQTFLEIKAEVRVLPYKLGFMAITLSLVIIYIYLTAEIKNNKLSKIHLRFRVMSPFVV